jgi:hypothetical protein
MVRKSIPGFRRDIYTIIGRGATEESGKQPGIVDSTGCNVAYVGLVKYWKANNSTAYLKLNTEL